MQWYKVCALLCFVTGNCAFQHYPTTLVRKSVLDASHVALKTCGVAKAMFRDGDRVVGGREAVRGEFPWQVSLRFKTFYVKPFHVCGATILNEKWIITAAHCVDGRSPKNFEVAVGMHTQDDKQGVTTYDIEEMIAHKDFDFDTFHGDIALLRLKKSISFSNSKGFVNGICLPSANKTAKGFAITTGWGSTVEDGDMAVTLQAVELPIVPHDICVAIFGGNDVILDSMLCAGEPEGGVDSCQGDSGGPLIQRNEDGRAVLVGIVSWGVGCARPGSPGVYTSVSSYIEWLLTHIA